MSVKKRSLDEEKYRSLFNKSMDWIYIHDFKGNFLDANPAALNGLGYTKEEISSIRFTSLIDKKQILKAFRTLLELKKTGTQGSITEFKIKRKDGGFAWVETKAAVIYKDGKPYAAQGIARDITHRKEIESKLRDIEEKYKALFERSLDWIFIHDWDNNMIDANEPALDALGYTREEMKSSKLDDILRKDQRTKAENIKQQLKISGRQEKPVEFIIRKKNGDELYVEVIATLLCREGKPFAIQGMARNITQQKHAEQILKASEQKHRTIFESSPTAIWYEDAAEVKKMLTGLQNQGIKDIRAYLDQHPEFVKEAAGKLKILDVNPAAIKLWDIKDKKSLLFLDKKFTESEFATFKNQMTALAEGKSFFEEETSGKTLSGKTVHYIIRTAIPGGTQYENVLVTETDITRRKQMETALEEANKKLQVQARTDSLTGLLNHGSFMQRLREELSREVREHNPVSLIMADIDFFKQVNDKYGHPAGDKILSDTARAIQSACRNYDIVGRYGGEEFAAVLPNTTSKKAAAIAERIRKTVAEKSHSWDGDDIRISISLGAASSVAVSGMKMESLLEKADQALLEAKKKGRNQVVVWSGNAA